MNRHFASFLMVGITVYGAACPDSFADSRSIAIDTKASIPQILELSISENALSELKFGRLNSSGFGPTLSEPKTIIIDIISNTGLKYVLTQSTGSALTNAQGDEIGLENLTFRTAATSSTGSVVSDFTVVEPSTQTIFSSNELGTSESVAAEYRLAVPASQPAGDYSTFITYTVSSV